MQVTSQVVINFMSKGLNKIPKTHVLFRFLVDKLDSSDNGKTIKSMTKQVYVFEESHKIYESNKTVTSIAVVINLMDLHL